MESVRVTTNAVKMERAKQAATAAVHTDPETFRRHTLNRVARAGQARRLTIAFVAVERQDLELAELVLKAAGVDKAPRDVTDVINFVDSRRESKSKAYQQHIAA
jgi:spore coat polysaccharide biosynthesis protein SpsF (cytidylyltransferase family)